MSRDDMNYETVRDPDFAADTIWPPPDKRFHANANAKYQQTKSNKTKNLFPYENISFNLISNSILQIWQGSTQIKVLRIWGKFIQHLCRLHVNVGGLRSRQCFVFFFSLSFKLKTHNAERQFVSLQSGLKFFMKFSSCRQNQIFVLFCFTGQNSEKAYL